MELLELFRRESNASFDDKWAMRVIRYKHYFVGRINAICNHPAFYGGHYIGTYPTRFVQSDRREFLEDLLGIDELVTRQLLRKIDGINPEFIVSSDVLNQAIIYALTETWNSKNIRTDLKESTCEALLHIMHYRFLGSLSARYFKYPGDKDIDEATYAALSLKYYLKQEKSWNGVLSRRATDILATDSIHIDVIRKYDNVLDVVAMINDIQTRIRKQWHGIFVVYLEVRDRGDRVKSSSSSVVIDGENVFLDRSRYQEEYVRYIRRVVPSDNFIKRDLMDIIAKELPRLNMDGFKDTLEYLNNNYLVKDKRAQKGSMAIPEVIDNTIIHMFYYLSSNRSKAKNINDISTIVMQIKGVYQAPRGNDPELLKLKECIGEYITFVTRIKTESTMASIRTAVMLYIVLRMLTKNYYS